MGLSSVRTAGNRDRYADPDVGSRMDVPELLSLLPLSNHLDIVVDSAADGEAAGHVDLQDYHSSTPTRKVAHGAVPYALADTVGGAATLSVVEDVTPTVDMRMDYHAPATGDRLEATASVVRVGAGVATVETTVTDGDGEPVASGRAVYKTGGGGGETAWTGEAERERLPES